MKIIHWADYHLGLDTHGPIDKETRLNGRVLDFLDALDALIEFGVEENVDLAVFAGDAYHKHSPEPTYQREFGERIMRLAEQCPVVLVAGNHDLPGSLERASAIDIFDALRAPNVIVGWDYETMTIHTKSGDIQVTTAPYPLRQQFITPQETRLGVDEVRMLLRKRLSAKLQELANNLDDNLPAILVGHFGVDAAIYSNNYPADQLTFMGEMAEVTLEDLLAWDYVALGHLHNHQNLTAKLDGAPPVVYSGSLERLHFAEEKDDKGFVLIELGETGVSWEFVLTDARPYVTIEVDCTDTDRPTAVILKKIDRLQGLDRLRSAVIRVIVNAIDANATMINQTKVYKALEDAGVYFVDSFNIRVERQYDNRLELAPGESLIKLSQIELIDKHLQHRGKLRKERRELIELAKIIIDQVENEQGF